MGDHRFSFKAEFEMHGIKDAINLNWCNWGDRYTIDSRIENWLREVVERAFAKFDEDIEKAEAERRKPEIENAERAELARLRAKYPDADT